MSGGALIGGSSRWSLGLSLAALVLLAAPAAAQLNERQCGLARNAVQKTRDAVNALYEARLAGIDNLRPNQQKQALENLSRWYVRSTAELDRQEAEVEEDCRLGQIRRDTGEDPTRAARPPQGGQPPAGQGTQQPAPAPPGPATLPAQPQTGDPFTQGQGQAGPVTGDPFTQGQGQAGPLPVDPFTQGPTWPSPPPGDPFTQPRDPNKPPSEDPFAAPQE